MNAIPLTGQDTMVAMSPFTNYTAAVVAEVLIIGFLVAVLLIGGILIVNLGLMSKRKQDRIGSREPSDVGILKNTNYPEQEEITKVFPAEDADEDDENTAA